MQEIVVYIILSVAAVTAGIMLYRRFTRPEQCSRSEGCTDCPLLEQCNKKKD